MVKRAKYIGKNNELQQEIHFSHPDIQFEINRIYNSHFTGSSLWDLFCKESTMVENSWNVSFRTMYNLPRSTHRYFVEPISGKTHVKTILIKNFLSFISQIENSKKLASKALLTVIKNNVSTVTGSNLKNIMKLTNRETVKEITVSDIKQLKYHPIPDEEEWRIGIVRDIIDIRNGNAKLENFNAAELNDMLDFACTK